MFNCVLLCVYLHRFNVFESDMIFEQTLYPTNRPTMICCGERGHNSAAANASTTTATYIECFIYAIRSGRNIRYAFNQCERESNKCYTKDSSQILHANAIRKKNVKNNTTKQQTHYVYGCWLRDIRISYSWRKNELFCICIF